MSYGPDVTQLRFKIDVMSPATFEAIFREVAAAMDLLQAKTMRDVRFLEGVLTVEVGA